MGLVKSWKNQSWDRSYSSPKKLLGRNTRTFDYQFCGDELFRRLTPALREKLRAQPVVATDLARLLWLRESLAGGYERAIWCDADVLLFRDFEPLGTDHAFGREIWVQARGEGQHSYRRIHNAWLQFDLGNVVLPFYIDRATKLLERVRLPVVPQFIGPKLLSALHNIVGFEVEERIGMLSPLCLRDVLAGSGGALAELQAEHGQSLCGVNLCASYVDRESDGVCHGDDDYLQAVQRLRTGGLRPT